MISESLVKKAHQKYISGDYQDALAFYLKASEMLGDQCFKVNVDLCRRKIKESSINEFEADFLKKYFEHVYVVNLEHQEDKKLKIANQLHKAGIQFEIFNAVNGYIGEPKAFFEEYIKKPLGSLIRYPDWNDREIKRQSHYIESAGAVGYIYTYLKILNDAKKRGFKKFLILEDDVILCNDFRYKLETFMAGVSPDWKVLQLGASQYGWDSVNLEIAEKKGHYYPKQIDTCGSFAIAFDGTIIDELIEAESAFEAPFDHLPLGEIYERYYGKCYVSYPNIIMPDVGNSTIRGGRCQYTHSQRVKWHIENYQYPYPRPSIAIVLSSATNLKYYDKFSNHVDTAAEIRLYYLSPDGIRPLHNPRMISSGCVADYTSFRNLQLPAADFYATLGERDVLTERDIYQYIEFALGLRGSNPSPLIPIEITPINVRRGRVSVIIPTYKRPTNLKNALTSVLDQNYHDIEILVVSDNGKDSPFNHETRALVSELKSAYPTRNLRLIEHKKNRNGAAARNTGILQSTGEYICFLDDDDIYLPGRISKSVDVLRKSRGIDGAVYCGFLGWNSPENDLNRYKAGNLTLEILLLDYKKHYLHTNTATYKREAVLALNGFDESYRRHQDLEFNLRFFEKFNIDAIKEIGVRLNPAPSDVSNKVFNMDLLMIKRKFLNDFDHILQSLSPDIATKIYEKHYEEVTRYITNKEDFLKSPPNGELAGIAHLYKSIFSTK